MKNIVLIQKKIDVSKIFRQIQQNPHDWNSARTIKSAEQNPELPVGVLQLVIGVVPDRNTHVGNSEMSVKTPLYNKYTDTTYWLKKNGFKNHSRMAFLGMPVGGMVGTHIDEGTYYQTRDRYHLSIFGNYQYTVGDEVINVEPGMFFWFNNKLPHSSINTGNTTRITLVFDLPHSKRNPQWKVK